ncbi:ATP-dependent helicase HrpB [Pontivivens insulae]|uniref:ATP-dependent helicase HrpB n=1 Tax=Pontivivens insulae TaxID=1639689 RepID=A0A2R8A637_9RHOB|nr:ATP-dependent helicase HrpB [Pontivivens insulae]RED17821.1 ATP-dependent helicase HrpB [Pontivivens insulae]SPF27711.1 hypothetical protein POI8812_00003 [Pontivivens insulae]
MSLPIEPILPDLVATLRTHNRIVLQAPPGAGKTTMVPLALLPEVPGKIVMLEPRRVAARAAAARLADLLGEPLGTQVGYRMRGDAKPGSRIEVVTEGILTRMIQSDPELTGIGTVIFDEFHERSLQADLGLALTLEIAEALRDDLNIVVMSATLDAGPVADLIGAEIITSEGRSYPVETRHIPRPLKPEERRGQRLATHVAATVRQALAEEDGSILVFLPGQGEIARTAALLTDLPSDVEVHQLFGAMKLADQRRAVAPADQGRKVVLATSIAETSLTIDGVRIVIDAGLARRARFDPASGMSRLVTERVTRAEAEQRRGRAGRTAPGICIRLWTAGEEGALAAYPLPEIADADLTGLALDLAAWGATPDQLTFLTPPPDKALTEAQSLLQALNCLEGNGLTPHGKAVARLPVHPRLAHMLLRAGKSAPRAARIAALLEARGPRINDGSDMSRALDRLGDRPELMREAKRLAKLVPARESEKINDGALLSLAYPDRIAKRRPGDRPRYHLSGGKGVTLDDADALAKQDMLVIAETDGHPTEAKVRAALPVTLSDLRPLHNSQFKTVTVCEWSRRHRRVDARERDMLGALVLEDRRWTDPPSDAVLSAALDGVRDLGLAALGWTKASRLLRTRISIAGSGFPDVSDATLLDSLPDWLGPHFHGQRTAADFADFDPLEALRAMLDWNAQQELDARVPAKFRAPTGTQVAIDWSDPTNPAIAIRLQELFGLTEHPTVAGLAIRLDLLSPAGRPVQSTSDLPGFWATSYADVRKDMRGRYPRHPWPEDPAQAEATRRAKPRGT